MTPAKNDPEAVFSEKGVLSLLRWSMQLQSRKILEAQNCPRSLVTGNLPYYCNSLWNASTKPRSPLPPPQPPSPCKLQRTTGLLRLRQKISRKQKLIILGAGWLISQSEKPWHYHDWRHLDNRKHQRLQLPATCSSSCSSSSSSSSAAPTWLWSFQCSESIQTWRCSRKHTILLNLSCRAVWGVHPPVVHHENNCTSSCSNSNSNSSHNHYRSKSSSSSSNSNSNSNNNNNNNSNNSNSNAKHNSNRKRECSSCPAIHTCLPCIDFFQDPWISIYVYTYI